MKLVNKTFISPFLYPCLPPILIRKAHFCPLNCFFNNLHNLQFWYIFAQGRFTQFATKLSKTSDGLPGLLEALTAKRSLICDFYNVVGPAVARPVQKICNFVARPCENQKFPSLETSENAKLKIWTEICLPIQQCKSYSIEVVIGNEVVVGNEVQHHANWSLAKQP